MVRLLGNWGPNCVAVCCSALQRVAKLQHLWHIMPWKTHSGASVTVRCSMLPCVALHCSVLQCVAVCWESL